MQPASEHNTIRKIHTTGPKTNYSGLQRTARVSQYLTSALALFAASRLRPRASPRVFSVLKMTGTVCPWRQLASQWETSHLHANLNHCSLENLQMEHL